MKAVEDEGETKIEDLQLTAERKLGESVAVRKEGLAKLKKALKEERKLYPRTDAAFLVRFLRARKYRHEDALKLVKNYYRLRKDNPTVFKDFYPTKLQHVYKSQVQTVLPKLDSQGRRIFVVRLGSWDPEIDDFDELFRANLLCLEHIIRDPETQIRGIVALVDLKGLAFRHLRHSPPSAMLRLIRLIQDCFPCRFKAFHIVNEAYVFHVALAIVRPVLRSKILNRMHFHGGDMNSLHEHLPPEVLPLEYGGHLDSFDNTDFCQEMYTADSVFRDDLKYGYIA